MITTTFRFAPALLALALLWPQEASREAGAEPQQEKAVLVQYLEIVTSDVDGTCIALEELHGVTFTAADASLGGARTAPLAGGGRIGVRAPMHEEETPVVRPYVLVDDVEAAVEASADLGGQVAMPATAVAGGEGTFAIYFLGGNQYGLWQR